MCIGWSTILFGDLEGRGEVRVYMFGGEAKMFRGEASPLTIYTVRMYAEVCHIWFAELINSGK